MLHVQNISSNENWGKFVITVIIPPALTIFTPSFVQKCEVFYFNQNKEVRKNFEEIKEKLDIEFKTKSYRFIFAFDNSGGKHFTDPISPPLDEQKFDFQDKIKGYVRMQNNNIDEHYFKKSANYKNILIERLCYDLINLEDNYEFRLMKIGDAHNVFSDEWYLVNPKNKIDKIKFFFKAGFTNAEEQNTDFYHFYDDLDKITDGDYIYILCIYSDFIHDITEIDKRYTYRLRRFDEECTKINEIQEKLTRKDIFQHIVYAPSKSAYKEYEKKILPDENNNKKIFHHPIHTADNSKVITKVTHEMDKLPMYISNNPEKIIATSVLMTFKNKGNKVEIENNIANNFSVVQIKDNGQEDKYDYGKELTTKQIRIKTKKEDESVKLKITENYKEYIMQFHFDKKLGWITGVFITLGFIFAGAIIGIICSRVFKKETTS